MLIMGRQLPRLLFTVDFFFTQGGDGGGGGGGDARSSQHSDTSKRRHHRQYHHSSSSNSSSRRGVDRGTSSEEVNVNVSSADGAVARDDQIEDPRDGPLAAKHADVEIPPSSWLLDLAEHDNVPWGAGDAVGDNSLGEVQGKRWGEETLPTEVVMPGVQQQETQGGY